MRALTRPGPYQFLVLLILGGEDGSVKKTARGITYDHLALTTDIVHRVIRSLSQRGLVDAVGFDDSQHARLFSLTDKGRAYVSKLLEGDDFEAALRQAEEYEGPNS